jgi:acyl dehydratase
VARGVGAGVACHVIPGEEGSSRAALWPRRGWVARRVIAGAREQGPTGMLPANQTQERYMNQVDTDQAAREASGAHPYGRYLEEFEVGAVYKHWPAKTVTESDDHLFCLITMNHHPLHINDVYAKQSQHGRNVVVGPLVYSLALGMSVSDVSGKAIANLATEELKHPAPVFHGDTLFCESEVLEVRPSQSKPDRGTVRVHTRVLNQDGTLVAEFKRLVLVPRNEPGGTGAVAQTAESNVE